MDKSAQEKKYLPENPLDLPLPHQMIPEHIKGNVGYANDVKTLLSWHAPGRPFRRRKKEYFINILLIMLAVLIILFLFSQYTLMLLVIALVFVNYALKTVAPHDFRYRISTEGVMVDDHFFIWRELYDFYFKHHEGEEVCIIRTQSIIPGELIITLGEMDKNHIKSVILPYLPFREYVRPTFMEKAGDYLSKTFPLEHSPHKN